MGNEFTGASPYLRWAGDFYHFNPVEPAKEFDRSPFIPNRGGGHDLSLTNGYSAYYFDTFGVIGNFGAGLFLSRYAPRTLVTGFTQDQEGNPNGLIENNSGGAFNYGGLTLQTNLLLGINLLDVLSERWAKLYVGGQLELEGRTGLTLKNSLQNEAAQNQNYLAEGLFKMGLAIFIPIELVKDRHYLNLVGANQLVRASGNNLSPYLSLGEPNFQLSLGYLFQISENNRR